MPAPGPACTLIDCTQTPRQHFALYLLGAFRRFGGTKRAWADEIKVAESQIGKYFSGEGLPRYEVMLRVAKIDRVPEREIEAYWRVAGGRSTFKFQEAQSLDDSASMELRSNTLVISRHVPFATEHPTYSNLVRQLVQSGARYAVVVPEDAALQLAVIVASCIRKSSKGSVPIQTVVYGIESARFDRVLPAGVSEVAVYSPDERHRRVAIQSGQVHGPGLDWLLEDRRTRAFVEDAEDAQLRARIVWNEETIRDRLLGGTRAGL